MAPIGSSITRYIKIPVTHEILYMKKKFNYFAPFPEVIGGPECTSCDNIIPRYLKHLIFFLTVKKHKLIIY